MPRSKKEKKISLTKTTKKGKVAKEILFQQIRGCIDNHHDIWVFSVHNMRANFLKDVRAALSESRLMFGRNRVMGKALGATEAEEYKVGLRHVTKNLVGQVGLLFTSEAPERIRNFFDSFSELDYARSGALATNTVTLPAGPLTLHDDQKISHSMEPQLRKLGLPTALVNGVVTLVKEYQVCEGGKPLTPEAAQILKHLQKPMAEFRVTLMARWSDGEFEQLETLDEETAAPGDSEGGILERVRTAGEEAEVGDGEAMDAVEE
ncbi:hypothetical protein SeMB42_g00128 [Synchytrium endobioticum]|uniref:Ribosome assembly factor mrt4 n=1 Tax=Synchytrium endobioticum TaxID=286115 RepID=A0A507DVB8_9FUNG|nr:hypothetical protein SeLEV6574_g00222 [Synchytrium endobioticum]TPX54898.1 hypothetical protein SeMB42_g00128 [Synchytrium endobioticum]